MVRLEIANTQLLHVLRCRLHSYDEYRSEVFLRFAAKGSGAYLRQEDEEDSDEEKDVYFDDE